MINFPKHRDAKTDDIPTDIIFPLKQEPRAIWSKASARCAVL